MSRAQTASRPVDAAHLSYQSKTNLGSFYTPPRIVRLVYELLARQVGSGFTGALLEPACGYGAFFAEPVPLPGCRLIGADIDAVALAVARQNFPRVTFVHTNMLSGVSRDKYGIGADERLVIAGNPPYNDVTSHVKNRVKAAPCAADREVAARDLGLSFLLAAARLAPEFIAVLHPLSYLIKRANFNILRPLALNYALREALVFSSQEFSETARDTGFPIAAAVYQRDPGGTAYEQIRRRRFVTLEGRDFSLADFDSIGNHVAKYPSPAVAGGPFRFYTLRDINALKRSRTFIQDDTANAIAVAPGRLPYYCYVDAFKDIAGALPYYLGNLDVMIDRAAFEKIKDDFVTLSVAKHPAIFQPAFAAPDPLRLSAARARVHDYFRRLFPQFDLRLP